MTTQPTPPSTPDAKDEHTPQPIDVVRAARVTNRLTQVKEGVTTTTSMEENL